MPEEKYVPSSLADWEAWLSEQPGHVNEWNGYAGECEAIVLAGLERFRGAFEATPGIERISHGVHHNGNRVIHVGHRFVFDPRSIPESYAGLQLRRSVVDLPREFLVGPGGMPRVGPGALRRVRRARRRGDPVPPGQARHARGRDPRIPLALSDLRRTGGDVRTVEEGGHDSGLRGVRPGVSLPGEVGAPRMSETVSSAWRACP